MVLEKIKSSTMAEIIGGFTSILLVIGISYKYGYFSGAEIEFKWILNLFSPVEILVANLQIVLYYATALIYMDYVFTSDKSILNTWVKPNIIILTIMAFLYYKNDGYFLMFLIFLIFNSVYCFVFTKYAGKLVSIIFLLVIIPYMFGSHDFTNSNNNNIFPLAYIDNEVKDWRVIDTFSDKAILMFGNDLKIVELKDIKYIENKSK